MKLELTKEEIGMLNELCFGEYLEMCKIQNNKYIDKVQVETKINKLNALLDKLVVGD